jgi:hypothetical protein
MNGDITRSTYRPEKRFSSVRQQQGRVPMDADWNEQVDIQAHHDRVVARDIVGPCGAPEVDGGFTLSVTPDNHDLFISPGRLYVDGILCELEAETFSLAFTDATHVTPSTHLVDGRPLATNQWIEVAIQAQPPQPVRIIGIDAQGQLTLSAGPTGAAAGTTATGRRLTTYLTQPDLLNLPNVNANGISPGIVAADGTYLAHADVWEQPLTALQEPAIREVALGGPDTATRTRIVAQVKLLFIPAAQAAKGCKAPVWDDLVQPSFARLAARSQPAQASNKPCILPAQAGYDQLFNQLYRVEIRKGGGLNQATFTFSRENASVEAVWKKTSGNDVIVSSTGRDDALGFAAGQYVELIDDALELAGTAGILTSITGVTGDTLTLVPPAGGVPQAPADALHPRVRRWDSLGAMMVEVPATNNGWIPLEHGVEVKFADVQYRVGDYWLIPARTITGDVEWPHDDLDGPLMQPPAGIAHHYCRLGVVKVTNSNLQVLETCLPTFPFLTAIDAEDVSYTGTCANAGPTVESAIDFLCAEKDFRFHNEHLHGTGIVGGYQVHCDFDQGHPGEVKILSGYAIDCHGNDLTLNRDRFFDVVTAIQNYDADPNHGQKIIKGTDGEAQLILLADQSKTDGIDFAVEPYDESKDTPEAAISATLYMDFKRDCIDPLIKFYKTETTPAEKDQNSPDTPQDHLKSTLTNLAAQLVNQPGGEHIYVSKAEDALLHKFYDDLRALLQSETFCAMFANARPFPDYSSFKTLAAAPMDIIFARGEHLRLRLHPKGREAYSVGPGINPVTPSTTLNRYDLVGKKLIAQVDPMAGTKPPKGTTTSGAGSIQDVALSPDGRVIYVIIPTRDGKDTFFRYGEIVGKTIAWGSVSVICGVKLMSLATTAADPKVVYAAGLGKGIYKIDPFNVAANALPQFPFIAAGELQMAMDGRYFATAAATVPDPKKLVAYNQLALGSYKDPAGSNPTMVPLPNNSSATDGIAIDVKPNLAGSMEAVYVALAPDADHLKAIVTYDIKGAKWVLGSPSVMDTAVSMAPMPGLGTLLVSLADDYSIRLMDLSLNNFVTVTVGGVTDNVLVPLQVAPVSVAVDPERSAAYVLNYASNTISTITGEKGGLLSTTYDTAPLLQELATYRQQALDAFADLLGGLAQYLKDCLCEHFLIKNPSCTPANQTLYLGAVKIKQTAGQWAVYRVCNFTKRHYVKSFPTIGYWLSMIPIVPLIGWAIGKLCCMLVTENFGAYNAPGYTPPPAPYAMNDPKWATVLQQAIGNAQGRDIGSKLAALLSRGSLVPQILGQAISHPSGFSLPIDSAAPAASGGWAIVNQSADSVAAALQASNVLVKRVPVQPGASSLVQGLRDALTDPPPGSQVTLHEDAGVVHYYTIDPSPASGELRNQVSTLSARLQARDSQIQELQSQLVAVQQKQDELAGSLQAEWVARQAFREELMQMVTRRQAEGAPPEGSAT